MAEVHIIVTNRICVNTEGNCIDALKNHEKCFTNFGNYNVILKVIWCTQKQICIRFLFIHVKREILCTSN